MAKYVDMIGWDDVPHLQPPNIPKEALDDMEASILPHQRQARRQGRPSLGSGAVYPIDEDQIYCDPVPIPPHWGRAYALDVGWNITAALFGAHDPDADIYYLTAEYYESKKEPVTHAHSLRRMMRWKYPGCIDPAAENSNQKDGSRLMREYEDLGLDIVKANNAVEAGIHRCLVLMQTGRLKAFKTLTHFKTELRLYRRNEKGKIVKERDHLMDCLRYLLNTDNLFKTKPMQRARQMRQGEWAR